MSAEHHTARNRVSRIFHAGRSDTPSGMRPENPRASIARLTDPDYAAMMKTVSGKLTEYQGGDCILTDDKAPVEVLGMRVLDELIEGELNYYRDQVKTNGLLSLIS